MTKISSYLVFLVVLITIAASASLIGIYYVANIDVDNNNNDTGLFPVAHAQSSSTPKKPTIILYLDKRENTFNTNWIGFDIRDMSTNNTNLQGATLKDKDAASVVLDNKSISTTFTLHIPDQTNPNIIRVNSMYLLFSLDTIETKPDGYKIYYGKSGFLSNKIGDNIDVTEGILIENGPSQAQLLMYTNSSNNSPITTGNTTNNGTELFVTYQTTEKIIK